jgi:hypothetical protein
MADQPFRLPRNPTVLASILKSRFKMDEVLCDMHETVLRTRETISQSLELIAKANEVLARS